MTTQEQAIEAALPPEVRQALAELGVRLMEEARRREADNATT